MRRIWVVLAGCAMMAAGGCVARTAWDVATLPVKAGGKVVDWSTTSPKERDEKYVREMRKREERETRARAEAEKRCRKHPETCVATTG